MYLLIIGKFFNIYRENSRSQIIALYYRTIRQVPFSSIIFQRTHTSLQPIAGKTRNHITKQYESHYRQENNMELSQLCFLIILLFLYNHMMQPTQPTSCSTTLKNQYNVPGKLHYLAAQQCFLLFNTLTLSSSAACVSYMCMSSFSVIKIVKLEMLTSITQTKLNTDGRKTYFAIRLKLAACMHCMTPVTLYFEIVLIWLSIGWRNCFFTWRPFSFCIPTQEHTVTKSFQSVVLRERSDIQGQITLSSA